MHHPNFLDLSAGFKVNCPLVGPGPIGDALPEGVFLRDPNRYLREFQRKPPKTPNGYVDKRDRGLNLAPPINQFWALPFRQVESVESRYSRVR